METKRRKMVTRLDIADALNVSLATLSAWMAMVDRGNMRPVRYQAGRHAPVTVLYDLPAVQALLAGLPRYTAAAAATLAGCAREIPA